MHRLLTERWPSSPRKVIHFSQQHRFERLLQSWGRRTPARQVKPADQPAADGRTTVSARPPSCPCLKWSPLPSPLHSAPNSAPPKMQQNTRNSPARILSREGSVFLSSYFAEIILSCAFEVENGRAWRFSLQKSNGDTSKYWLNSWGNSLSNLSLVHNLKKQNCEKHFWNKIFVVMWTNIQKLG